MLLACGLAALQPPDARAFGFGVKGGLTLAYQTDPRVITADYAPRGGFLAGAFVSFRLSGRISLQPELCYSRKGVQTTDRYYSEEVRNRWQADYLECPVLLKVGIGSGGKIRPALLLGPYIAYRLSAKRVQTGFGTTEEKDTTGEVWPGDYGLILAGLVEYRLGPGTLVLDARLGWGLANTIFKGSYNSWVDPPPDPSASRNRTVSLLIGYGF